MSAITTHVLDVSRGCPAAGIAVRLERVGQGLLGQGRTDADGRLRTLLTEGARLEPGSYRLAFDVEDYFAAQGVESFYPTIEVTFFVRDGAQHHHVPVLLSPFGYSTYRGS
ncbi:MAG TPA: hydroxyisourate hydrolase [Tepidisphaeraceae bacterium]|jgi:5-hydroxyisourate hydrolase